MRGVFLDIASINPQDLDLQPLLATLDNWQTFDHTSAQECAARIRDAAVVVTNKVVIDDTLIRTADKLQLICVAATGTNNIDSKSAEKNGVAVKNVRAYATASVTEHVFALLLTLTRQLDRYRAASAKWPDADHFCVFDAPIQELAGKKLGIIGYGELGSAVARLGQALGMHILIAQSAHSRVKPDRIPLDEFLPQVDVLSLHCPLTTATEHLIGRHELGLMQSHAILINTARGGLIDDQALLAALRTGQISAAAIDVLTEEPPPENLPLINAKLPNLIVTPHVAWASQPARQRLVNGVAENIRAFLAQGETSVTDESGC